MEQQNDDAYNDDDRPGAVVFISWRSLPAGAAREGGGGARRFFCTFSTPALHEHDSLSTSHVFIDLKIFFL